MIGEQSAESDRIMAALVSIIVEYERAHYSARVLEEARHPSNMGAMLEADAYGLGHGSCGDTMEIFLRLDGSRIERASFMTDGCGPTVACGSMLTKLIRGLTAEEAAAIDGGDLLIALDGLPPEHVHCATLAVNTLREALSDLRAEGASREG